MNEATTGRAMKTFLTLALKADRSRLIGLVLIEMAWRSMSIVGAYGLKMMVDAVTARRMSEMLIGALVTAAPLGIQRLGGPLYVRIVYDLTERLLLEVETTLARAVSGAIGIEHLETPKYLDEITLAGRQRGMVASMMRVLVTAVQGVVLLVASNILLAQIEPWALALPIFGVPAYLAGKRAAVTMEKANEANAEPLRRRNHIYSLTTSPVAGKELRIFGLFGELLRNHRNLTDQIIRTTNRAAVRAGMLRIAGGLVFTVGYVGAIALVIQRAAKGQATPGDVILALTLASQVNGQVAALAESGETFARITKTAKRFVGVLDYPELTNPRPPDPLPVPQAIVREISLDHVSFTYVDAEFPALEDVSIRLPSGAVVALVGENGAGKTTLVKLLCRMYEPQQGSIAVDGTVLDRFDPIMWRARTSAAFQDFVRFELTIGETVGIGDVPKVADEGAVMAALSRAGAREIVEVGPKGLQTQLGKAWEDGIDLSGGQWQKLALARSLMRTDPLLLIFDEPTSALDAETEHALFERFAAATRADPGRGMVTLLVSHRFSTVRMADLIIVMDKGRVIETGSHEELIATGGLYRELYELQARGYR